MGSYCLMGIELCFARWIEFCGWVVVNVHSDVNVLNATELYSLLRW